MMKTNNLTASLIGSVTVAGSLLPARHRCGVRQTTIARFRHSPIPQSFTKSFVQQAIDRYDEEGRDATIAYYNTKESVDGEWYIFITDESDVTIAHASVPDNIGQSIRGPLGVDSTGYAFGAVMADATEEGMWVSYVYLNPVTGEEGTKHSWVVERDGLVFGSGWYEPTN